MGLIGFQIRLSAGLYSFLEALRENTTLSVLLSRDSHSLAYVPIPSLSKPATVGQVLLIALHSDLFFCLPLLPLGTLVIALN